MYSQFPACGVAGESIHIHIDTHNQSTVKIPLTSTTVINAPESRSLIFLWSIKDTDGSARRMLFGVIISDSRIFPGSSYAKLRLCLHCGHDVLYCWKRFTAGSNNIIHYEMATSNSFVSFMWNKFCRIKKKLLRLIKIILKNLRYYMFLNLMWYSTIVDMYRRKVIKLGCLWC